MSSENIVYLGSTPEQIESAKKKRKHDKIVPHKITMNIDLVLKGESLISAHIRNIDSTPKAKQELIKTFEWLANSLRYQLAIEALNLVDPNQKN